MFEQGDVCLTELDGEVRRRVVVLSDPRFERLSGRVLIAPAIAVDVDEVLPPWRVASGDEAFAVDLMRTVWAERVLERVDRAPSAVVERLRRAIRHIA